MRVVIFLVATTASSTIVAQENQSVTQTGTARIVWSKQAGVSYYRLQIATDQRFNDVIFDRRINGFEYVVRDLPPGRYFWRVAQAESQTGEFLSPVPFEVKLENTAQPTSPSQTPSVVSADTAVRTRLAIPGWSVATGEIVKLVSAQLRRGAAPDFVGVNSTGTVYAIQGSRGIALWTAHFNLGSSGDSRVRNHYRQFTPLIASVAGASANVIVAFDQGVRALDGATGREIWNTRIAGRPSLGVVIERAGALPSICLVAENATKLLVLDAATGQLQSQMTLRDEAVQPPVVLTNSEAVHLLVPLKGGHLEQRTIDGKYVRSIKVATEISTQLQVVSTPRGKVLLVGLKNGLLAFDAVSLQPLGRIALEGNDYPVGSLALADLNADKILEVIMSTNAGRIVAIDVSDGKIRWSTDVGNPGAVLSFADLDGDAKPDVILPGLKRFAVGLSGSDGSVIWRSSDESDPVAAQASTRSLAVAQLADGRVIIVGSDRLASGLRALEVTRVSAKANP